MSPDPTTAAALIAYTVADEGVLVFTPSDHRYHVAKAAYRQQRVRLTTADGTVLHLDDLNVASDLARARFVKAIKAKTDDAIATVVRRELTMIATDLATILPDDGPASLSREARDDYSVTDAGIWYRRFIPNSPVPIDTQISNFGAEIVADVTINDGVETRREYEVDCWQGELRQRATPLAEQFAQLGWVTKALGSGAVVFPGSRHAEHVAAAIQLTSRPERRSVFGHTGWKQLEDGTMGYLSASGAMTGDGLREEISVKLDPPLDRYCLPEPPAGDDLIDAWRALLDILELAPRSVTMPLLCTVIRSLLKPSDFALYLKAATGEGKTQLAGVLQAAFGAGLGPDHLPANFTSTGNSLELTANLAKDALLVIDDFQRNRATNADATAERIGRALGNQSGRARLTRDAQLRSQRPPRGTIVMTGEDAPKGESLRARMAIVELPRGGMRWDRLSACQQAAKAGIYAAALAGLVQWIAADHDGRLTAFDDRFETVRAALHSEYSAHARSTTTAAHLLAAFSLLLDFLADTGGWDQAARDALEESAEAELRSMITAQAHHLAAVNPVEQFLETLDAVLVSGDAHLANPQGGEPINPGSWGWRTITTSAGDEWRPLGKRIGWKPRDRPGVYLEWTATFQLVQKRAVEIGSEFPIGDQTLLRRLHERGLLIESEPSRQTLKVRKYVEERQRPVVYLAFPLDDEEGEA